MPFDIPIAFARFSCMVPSPVPVLTGTVQVILSLVVGVPMLAFDTPLTPIVVTLKLLADTPVTAEPKTAVKLTEAEFVVAELTLAIELIVVDGAVTVLEAVATFTLVAPIVLNTILPEYVFTASDAAKRTYIVVAASVPIEPTVIAVPAPA